MRIAQVSPLIESVPPKAYGGTERIVSYLTEGLVNHGHQVTLFASADSVTKAKLVSVCPQGLRLYENKVDTLAYHYVQLEEVVKSASEFDVIHFHNDYLHFPVSRHLNYAHLNTLHGRLDIPGLSLLYEKFPDMPVVSISNHQRLALPQANWISNIYHGLPIELYRPEIRAGSYLAFLGRISIEKRLDRAIKIAQQAGIPLKVAAKIDPSDTKYFEKKIKHLLDDPLVEFIGEIGEDQKGEFLGNAAALLFPIDWPEPFGLVMIEAMACGTPVIAYNQGSVPEIVDEGITGYIVSSVPEAVKAISKLHRIDREACRKKFEERFDVNRMVIDYENVYIRVAELKNKYSHA
jgi:glycosyltransferase involved in cell wall biosynthesis